MKRFILAMLGITTTLTLQACEKPVKVLDISKNVDSYTEQINKEREVIKGTVTLEKGDYALYGEKPVTAANGMMTGFTTIVSDKGETEVFGERDYFHVPEDITVTINNGYLLKLEDAIADNGEIRNNGVYLVGFDIKENTKLTNGDYVEICDSIPNLFEVPNTILTNTWSINTLEEGQVIRLIDSYAVTRKDWDIDAKLANFNLSWKDTSIDYKRGYKEEISSEEKDERKGNQIVDSEQYVLLTSNKRNTIDVSMERQETDVRAYYQRVWFKNTDYDTMTTNADKVYIVDITDDEFDKDGNILFKYKMEKGKYTPADFTKPSLSKALNGIYLVGIDIPKGQYRVTSGYLYRLDEAPTLDSYLDTTTMLDSAVYYTTDSVVELSEGEFVAADKLKITSDKTKRKSK